MRNPIQKIRKLRSATPSADKLSFIGLQNKFKRFVSFLLFILGSLFEDILETFQHFMGLRQADLFLSMRDSCSENAAESLKVEW